MESERGRERERDNEREGERIISSMIYITDI